MQPAGYFFIIQLSNSRICLGHVRTGRGDRMRREQDQCVGGVRKLLQNSIRCIIMHLKANIATGSWLKPAERRLSGLDPEPDLDNANVGRDIGK